MNPLASYLSPEAREARFEALAHQTGASLEVFGRSVEGRSLRAALFSSRTQHAPTLLVVANIHGPEFIGSQVALGVIEACARGDDTWSRLRDRARLVVVPCLNPDGYARTWQHGGRGSLGELRVNARGVDLNRNFPLPTGTRRWPIPGSGSSNPQAATYYGSSPASEPETQALIELARAHTPHAAVGLHSFMGRLIPARTRDRDDYARYGQLCRDFAQAQPSWQYKRLANRIFDVFTGEQEDYLHHELGCWSICVETYTLGRSFGDHLRAPSLFARFNPADPQAWVDNDVPGIAAYFDAALKLPRPGHQR